jgi:hypothetical protein
MVRIGNELVDGRTDIGVVLKLSGLRAPKQFLLQMFVNSEGQLFIFPRKNENCESVAGSEK